MTHELKTWIPFYAAVLSGEKTFEVRKNDRGFQRGDTLLLREYDIAKARRSSSPDNWNYTGRSHTRLVTYVLTGEEFGIVDGYAVLGLGEARQIKGGE